MVPLVFHPLTILSFVSALFFHIRKYSFVSFRIKAAWILGPPLFNIVIWIVIFRLFALTMNGLAAWFQFFVFIPLNGLLFGIFSLTGLHRLLRRIQPETAKIVYGLVLQMALLAANFILWYWIDSGNLIVPVH